MRVSFSSIHYDRDWAAPGRYWHGPVAEWSVPGMSMPSVSAMPLSGEAPAGGDSESGSELAACCGHWALRQWPLRAAG